MKLEGVLGDYVASCDPLDEFKDGCRDLANTIITTVRLYAVRPLQRHPAMRSSAQDDREVLKLAIDALSTTLRLTEQDMPWRWFAKGFVSWHPLAVALAVLAVTTEISPSIHEAWTVADRAFSEFAVYVADGMNGSLWRLLNRLMRAARARKETLLSEQSSRCLSSQVLPLSEQGGPANVPMSDPTMHDLGQTGINQSGVESWACWEAIIDDFVANSALHDFFQDVTGDPKSMNIN